MIPEKLINTVMKVIPDLSRDAVIAKLEHGIKTNKIDDPKEASLYRLCDTIRSLDLKAIVNRTTLISIVVAKSGLSRTYVSAVFSQNNVALPEHLQGYIKKTRGPIVAGVRDIVEFKRGNPQSTVLSIDRTLKERLVDYAERHKKPVREVAQKALISFLEAEIGSKRGRKAES